MFGVFGAAYPAVFGIARSISPQPGISASVRHERNSLVSKQSAGVTLSVGIVLVRFPNPLATFVSVGEPD